MADPALLEARAKVLAQARAALDALVIWEITQCSDVRRYHRAAMAMDMARDLEKAYATRVSDVDTGIDTPLGHAVMDGRARINFHVDRDPMGDYVRQGMVNVAVDQANIANTAYGAIGAAQGNIDAAEGLLRQAHRAIDELAPHDADRVIDRVNGVPPMIPPVLDAEARRAIGENPFDDVPAHVRAAIHAQRHGAPYDAPPLTAVADLEHEHIPPQPGAPQ